MGRIRCLGERWACSQMRIPALVSSLVILFSSVFLFHFPISADSSRENDTMQMSWSQDFDDGDLDEMYVSYDDTDGGNADDYGNLVEVSTDQYVSAPYGLHIESLNLNGASVARAFAHSGYMEDWETLLNYTVSVSFLLPGTDNHWLVVLKTMDVHLVLVGDMLKAHSAITGETENITQLNLYTWYGIRCDVPEFSGEYEVIINGTSYGWYNATSNLTYPKIVSLGDLDDSLSPDSRGEGYWDDLRLDYRELEIGPIAYAGPDKTAGVGENVDFLGEGVGSFQNDTWESHPFGWDDWIDMWPPGTNVTEYEYNGNIYAGLVAVEYFSGRAVYAPGSAFSPHYAYEGVMYQLLVNSVKWASHGKLPSSASVLFVWGHEELTTYASAKWNGPSALSSEGYNVYVEELIPPDLSNYDVVIMLAVGWNGGARISQQGYNKGWCSVWSSGCPQGSAPTSAEIISLLDFVNGGGGLIASAEKSDGSIYLNGISVPMGVHFSGSSGANIWANKTVPSHPILSRWEGTRAPVVSWLWDFGDGSPQFSGRNASHVYTAPGVYNVTLTVVDSLGLMASDNCSVHVILDNLPPVADAGPDQTVNEGDIVQFNGSGSFDPDGNIVSYEWDLDASRDSDGDGNSSNDVDATGPTPTHIYGDDGAFIVILTVNDSYGVISADACHVAVDNVDPVISVTPPIGPLEGDLLSFNASMYDPGSDDLTSIWTWGDDSNESWVHYNDGIGPDPPDSPDVNPMSVADQWNHYYGHAGSYLVNLTVLDDDGGKATSLIQLDVSNVAPTVILDIVDPNPVAEGSSVQLGGYFDDPSWLDNHTVVWDFGDGQGSQGNYTPGIGFTHHTIENATHVYGDDGSFQVVVNVTDDYGGSDQSSVLVTVVNRPPTATISCPSKVSVGSEFQCSSSAIDPGSDDLAFEWNWTDESASQTKTYYNNGMFPDPYPSPGPTFPFQVTDAATHRYYSPGNFTIHLNISDDDGDGVALQSDIHVVGLPDTTILVGDPKYVSADTYVTSLSPISFLVLDGSGEGIESTYFRIDSGYWTRYISQFYVPIEGPHTIHFNSTDALGGAEETKHFNLIVDDTPPLSSVEVGTPNYTSEKLWISPSTSLTVESGDSGCGLSHIEFQLDGEGWNVYSGPVVEQEEGSHVLSYRGIDHLGNVEPTQELVFHVDGTPPWSSIHIDNYRRNVLPIEVFLETEFTITSLDNGSGLKIVMYRVDSGPWSQYVGNFDISDLDYGMHEIEFQGTDNIDNIEQIRSLTVVLVEPATLKENLKPLVAVAFALALIIVGILVALKRPFTSEKRKKRRVFTFSAIALPYILAELVTGILSLFIDDIQIPPWFGLGLILDLAILVSGLITECFVYSRKKDVENEEIEDI